MPSPFRLTTPLGPPVQVESDDYDWRYEPRVIAPRGRSISADYPEFYDDDDRSYLYEDERVSPVVRWFFGVLALIGVCMVALATAQPAQHVFAPPQLSETPTLPAATPEWDLPATYSAALAVWAEQNVTADQERRATPPSAAAAESAEPTARESRATEPRESRATEPRESAPLTSPATVMPELSAPPDLQSVPPESTAASPSDSSQTPNSPSASPSPTPISSDNPY